MDTNVDLTFKVSSEITTLSPMLSRWVELRYPDTRGKIREAITKATRLEWSSRIDFFHIDGVIRRSARMAWRKTGKAGNMALFTMAANDRPS